MSDLVVTHHHGMLAAYTRNGTHELTQRALIDVGDDERSARELIEIVDELSLRFAWHSHRQLPAAESKSKPKQLEAAKPRQYPKSRRTRAGRDEMATRRQRVLDDVRAHSDTTVSEVTTRIHGPDYTGSQISDVRKCMARLVNAGVLARQQDAPPHDNTWLYRAVES